MLDGLETPMKKVFLFLLQFCLFLACFAAGSFVSPFQLRQVLGVTPEGTRVFVWDGVVLMLLAAALVVLIEALRRRLWPAAALTCAALLLAGAAGYALRLGFMTI